MFRRRSRGGQQEAGRSNDPAALDEQELAEDGEFDDEDLVYSDDEDFEDAGLADEFDDQGEFENAEPAEAGPMPADARSGRASSRADLGDPGTWTRLRDPSDEDSAVDHPAGPWDSRGGFPDAERIDFGSLLVPVREGYDVQVFMSEEEGISIAVVHGESGIQLQPFAAPRSAGLWSEVLPEIADEVAKAGGHSSEQEGPFGPELLATVTPQGADGQVPQQPLRFLGVDGPRWFLRGLISGPAATDQTLAEPLEEIFAGVVVVRGEHAEPPRKPLEIRLPEEARQVLESQLEAEPEPLNLNPFERGPEITETR
ncbi:MAG TPA: DUF3710 domain-containing protein [Streptosporangiaceae bacterium]